MVEFQVKPPTTQKVFTTGNDTLDLLVGEEALALLSEPKFQGCWHALYEACPWGTVFQSWSFVATWYSIYQKEYLPILIIAKQPGKITGLLALARDKSGVVVGAGANQAEYQVWLNNSDNEDFIKKALLEIRKHFPKDGIELKYIPDQVSLDWVKKDSVWNKHCFLQAYKHPFLVINDVLLNDERRKKNRKEKINRLKRLGEVKFERITDKEVFTSVFDELALQSDFRKGAMFNKTAFQADPKRKKFLLALFEQNILHATVLKLNDKIIASNVSTTGKRWVHMQGINSHAPSYAKYSPGILHFLLLDKLLVEEGVNVFDLTPGGESYKERLSSDSTQAYRLRIGSVYQTFVCKIKFTLINHFKKYMSGVGITPGALKKIKWSVYLFRDKIYHAGKQGLISLIKRIIAQVRPPGKIRKYSLIADAFMRNSTDLINIQKDNLRDLLDFQHERGTRLMRWEFLASAMSRLENEEHCYSWAEGGHLLGCAWLRIPKISTTKEGQSGKHTKEAVWLQGIYCHAAGQDRLQAFLMAAAAEAIAYSNGSQIYAVAADGAHCRALEAAGFLFEKTSI